MDRIKTGNKELKKAETYQSFKRLSIELSEHKQPPFIYDLPVPKAAKKNSLMLDLQPHQGSWLVAASKKKYVPIGMTQDIESARLIMHTLRVNNTNGYVVVAEHEALPFQPDLFDLIWAFDQCEMSTSESWNAFAEKLSKLLAKSGKLKLAINNRSAAHGHLNGNPALAGQAGNGAASKQKLKYYTDIFRQHFSNVRSTLHSCFGEPALKEQLTYAKQSQKPIVASALFFAYLSQFIPQLNKLSGSTYLNASKNLGSPNFRIHHFLKHHWLKQNLNVVYLLQCPITGGPVYLSKDSCFVISDLAQVRYPIVDEIPIMLRSEALDLRGNKPTIASFNHHAD